MIGFRRERLAPANGVRAGEQPLYAIGDVHGRYDLLRALLAEINRDAAERYPGVTPLLVLCGDYVDRGPASAEVLAALTWLLRRTSIGLHMRAAAEDFTMAQLVGVRANSVILAAFVLSGLLAAVVALLFVAQTGFVHPRLGVQIVLVGFVVADGIERAHELVRWVEDEESTPQAREPSREGARAE